MSKRRFVVSLSFVVVVLAGSALSPRPSGADGSASLWVDGSNAACSDGYSRDQAASPDSPWCSIARAAAAAQSGDTVRIKPGRYVGSVRPAASGTVFVAEGDGVVVDAAGASAAVKLASVSDVTLRGLTVTGAAAQGIWASGVQRVTLDGLTVNGNGGHGIQVLNSTEVTVGNSTISGNGGAGIFEGNGSSGCAYVSNGITGNGKSGDPYNGDGIQLGGAGGYIAGNTVRDNGDGPYEHGVYTGPSARDFLIEGNVLGDNAGSNIKAAGANGTIRYNRLEQGRLGIVFSDNPAPVVAYYNLVFGKYQHGVFVTTGNTPAQARLWNNTIVVTARNATSGDASAVFVKAAALLDMRNNVVSYANADNFGSAVDVPDARQVTVFTSDHNWLSSMQPRGRHVVWDGARMTVASWTKATGQDGASVASTPPQLDAGAHVVSANLGRSRGQSLGLTRDYIGTAVPSGGAPDIGAYQTP